MWVGSHIPFFIFDVDMPGKLLNKVIDLADDRILA